jgi:hypothetical protein
METSGEKQRWKGLTTDRIAQVIRGIRAIRGQVNWGWETSERSLTADYADGADEAPIYLLVLAATNNRRSPIRGDSCLPSEGLAKDGGFVGKNSFRG